MVQILCENWLWSWEFVLDLLPLLMWCVWLSLHMAWSYVRIAMIVYIFRKDDLFFKKKKISVISGSTSRKWRQIQICYSSTRNRAIPWQLPNSKVPDCCHIGTRLGFSIEYSCHTIINIKHEWRLSLQLMTNWSLTSNYSNACLSYYN